MSEITLQETASPVVIRPREGLGSVSDGDQYVEDDEDVHSFVSLVLLSHCHSVTMSLTHGTAAPQPPLTGLAAEMVGLAPKWVRSGQNGKKSGAFSDQISVHFSSLGFFKISFSTFGSAN